MASTSANKTETLQSDRYSESECVEPISNTPNNAYLLASDDSGRGGSRFNQNLSQIHDSYTTELCQIVGCLRPVVPGSPYCAGSHRRWVALDRNYTTCRRNNVLFTLSNSNVFVTKTASTSASKTGNFQAGESDSDSGSECVEPISC